MAKDSIVLELQRDALNPAVPVSDLLRKALLVASKLGQRELETWINNELNGYPEIDDFTYPPYRLIVGELKALNPFRGWVPLHSESPELLEALSRRPCSQRVAELEHLLAKLGDGADLTMPLHPHVQVKLQSAMKHKAHVDMFVSTASLAGILDEVRNVILKWSIKLEKDGVLGEGLSFSPKERETAARTPTNVNNFFGPVHQPQIQQNSPHSTQIVEVQAIDLTELRALLADLTDHIDRLSLGPDARSELVADVRTVNAQLASPMPKAPILREGLRSIGRILEGATGNVAGELLLRLPAFLAQIDNLPL
jgi:hypothetical protein